MGTQERSRPFPTRVERCFDAGRLAAECLTNVYDRLLERGGSAVPATARPRNQESRRQRDYGTNPPRPAMMTGG